MAVKVKDSPYMKKVEINGFGEEVIDRMVASGRCENADQAVDISLRLLSQYEAYQKEKLKTLREDIAVGMEEVYRGRVAPLDMEAIIRESKVEHAGKNPSA